MNTSSVLLTRGGLCFVFLLIGTLPFPAGAQLASAGAYFQVISTSPRAHALGEATVALRGYPGALQLNPATIGQASSVNLSTTLDGDQGIRTPWLPSISSFANYWIASPSIDVKRGRWAGAYQWKELSLGTHECRTAQNDPCDTYRSYQRSHKLAAAYDVIPTFTVGASVNWIQIQFAPSQSVGEQDIYNPNQISLDLGVYYEHPFSTPYADIRPSVGWSLTDFGGLLHYDDNAPSDPLPMMMRGGLSVQASTVQSSLGRPIVTLGLHGALSQALVHRDDAGEADGPFKALFTGWKTITVRNNPLTEEEPEYIRFSAWKQLTTHGGIELSLLEILSVRWGAIQDEPHLGPRHYATRGWTVDLYYLALSRSKVTTQNDFYTAMGYWMLTARIPFEASPDNFWPDLIRKLR